MFNYKALQLRNKVITVNTVYHSIFLYETPKRYKERSYYLYNICKEEITKVVYTKIKFKNR